MTADRARRCAILVPVMAPSRHRFLRFVAIVVLGGLGVGLCVAALVPGVERIAAASRYSGKVAPQLHTLDQPSLIYDTNGAYFDTIGTLDRRPVSLSDVPKPVVHAVLAAEDQTFYDNPGIDVQAIVRALVSNVESGEVDQGGSTITQQLIKNRYFKHPARDLDRKVKEAVLALRLNGEWSKDRILQEYLNTVYFGEGAYGIGAAAARFFGGASLEQLDVAQAALLAGVIGDPDAYNPFVHPDAARARRAVVLQRMVDAHYLTKDQANLANLAPLPTVPPDRDLQADTYYADWIQQLLTDPQNPRFHDFDALGTTGAERERQLFERGLRIYSAFDPRVQFLAQAALDQVLPKQPPFTAAIAVVNPKDGSVPAIAAGIPFGPFNKCNLATMPSRCSTARQPGSTFKGITLTTAIANGYSPRDTIDGSSPCTLRFKGKVVNPEWKTRNAEGGGGTMSLQNATRDSVNCAFFRLGASLDNGVPGGWNKVLDMANRLGVQRDLSSPGCRVPVAVIGNACGVSPLDMATAYATLDNDGVHHTPVFIRRIEDPDGRVLYDANPQGNRAVDPQVARTVTDVLTHVTEGTAPRARLPGNRPLAGKTGTTDEKVDAWFVGYTPQLVAAVWMGNPAQLTPMTRVGSVGTVYGGTYPAMIWQRFMSTAMEGQPALGFTPPDTKAWPSPRYVTEDGRDRGTRSGSRDDFGPRSRTSTTRGEDFPPPPPSTDAPPDTTPTSPPETTPPSSTP